jgi:3-methyladenine DNA glycosylase/8-oxoguanine DNA glycosylase
MTAAAVAPDLVDEPIDGPFDLDATCRSLHAGGDPSWRSAPGRVCRARRTPDGPATVEIERTSGGVRARAWGPGAVHALAGVRALVGADDSAVGFRPELHPVVRLQAARRDGVRVGAGGSLWDAAVPVILAQRVTGAEARRSWWQLAWRHGTEAPGPHGLRLGPTPRQLARMGTHHWHVLGVERRRADAVRRIAAVLPALDRAAATGSTELQRALRTVPGVGPWTATALAIAVLGDPDCVLLGDLHVPHHVCHALAREERGSDERMLELLEPWAGHRGRVVRLVTTSTLAAPRRGPRYTPLPIARW